MNQNERPETKALHKWLAAPGMGLIFSNEETKNLVRPLVAWIDAQPSAPVAPEPDGPILKAPWMAFDPREQYWYNVPTQAEAVAKANELVDGCCVDGGWDEEVTEIVVAKVTHVAVKRLLHTRTDDMTDEQWYGLCGPFSSEHREWFTYDIVPPAAAVPVVPEEPAGEWHCEGDAVGVYWEGICSPENPIHSSPCGPIPSAPVADVEPQPGIK